MKIQPAGPGLPEPGVQPYQGCRKPRGKRCSNILIDIYTIYITYRRHIVFNDLNVENNHIRKRAQQFV